MISDWTSNEILDISLHAIVWYLALVLFFYSNVKKAKAGANAGFTKLAQGAIPPFLDSIQTLRMPGASGASGPSGSLNTVPYWTGVQKIGTKLISESTTDSDDADKSNRNILFIHSGVVGGALILWILAVVFLQSKGVKVNLMRLLLENLVILVVMFGLESSFLTKNAPKYQGFVAPAYQLTTALERIKQNLR